MNRLGALFLVLVLAGCVASGLGPNPPGSVATHRREPRVRTTPTPPVTAFTTKGRNIMLSVNGGKPGIFYIKGVDYSPTQICSSYIEPLDDSNQAIWSKDLTAMRAMGVNAVKVYTMGFTHINNTWAPIKIGKWLAAAYNGGNKPIYTILSIGFPAGVIDNPTSGAITALSQQYYVLAKKYGPYPGVMGISIGDEWNQHPDVSSSSTWKNGVNPIIQAAWQGLIDGGVGNAKILTTTLVDDLANGSTSTMSEGEANGFPPTPKPTGPPSYGATAQFAWGFDVYRGDNPPFSKLWSQVIAQTKHPFIVAEWGEPVAYHPHPNSQPTLVQEYPKPVPTSITNYVSMGASTLYNHSTIVSVRNNNPASGGFYFEWSDEWWKASNIPNPPPSPNPACKHIGGNLGTNPNPDAGFPSGFDDEAWFGLNSVKPGTPNVMKPRANLTKLQSAWATEL